MCIRDSAHPALGFGKDAAEDIFAQIEDQPAFLAQRNEDRGRDGALFGVVPAHQRFHRADMAAPVHLRLVHHIPVSYTHLDVYKRQELEYLMVQLDLEPQLKQITILIL